MMRKPLAWATVGLVAAMPVAVHAEADAADPAADAPTSIAQLLVRNQAPIVQPAKPFTEDDFVLLDVLSGKYKLGEGLSGYASRSGVYLPLAELSRLIDLALTVDAAHGRAEGFILKESRTLTLDLNRRSVQLSGADVPFTSAQVVVQGDDIFVRTDLLQKLVPATFEVNARELEVNILPKEPFPFQERIERENRRDHLGGEEAQPVLAVRTPYALFTPPAFDLNLALAGGNNRPRHTEQFDVRAAGDLLYSDLQLFAGSDPNGRISNARVLLERKDPDGKETGVPGMTRISVGDTFTPNMQIGPSSAGGRGISFTNAALQQANVFDTIDIRGEQPVGWEVELYLNEVLQAAQPEPINGRYEFKGVRLAYGLNTIRVVLYGPRGERRQDVRRINVGASSVAKGKVEFSFAAVQQDLNVIDIRQPGTTFVSPTRGDWRVAGGLAYGLTKNATATAGISHYSPSIGSARTLATAGLSTSFDAYAAQATLAADDQGGQALLLGLAGRTGVTSLVGQHTEYRGGFADEVQSGAFGAKRNTSLNVTTILGVPRLGEVPVNFRLGRLETANDTRWTAGGQASKPLGRYLVSTSVDYQSTHSPGGNSDSLNGTTDVSTLFGGGWQVRASSNYALTPSQRLTAIALTADKQIGQNLALRFGANHTFTGVDTNSVQLGATWRLDRADFSVVGSYLDTTNDFRLGINLAMGFGYDQSKSRYVPRAPGVATGGSMQIQAFVDENADGVQQSDEKPIAGIKIAGGRREIVTDAQGRATVTGLGDGVKTRVRLDIEGIDDPYLVSPPTMVELVPRPGRTATVNYPLVQTGEAEIRMMFAQEGQAPRGLSALAIQLIDAKGEIAAEGRTEYDGSWFAEKLRPGTYEIRLDPKQAATARLALRAPIKLVVPAKGGFAGRITGEVVLAKPK